GIRVFHVTGVQTCALPISTDLPAHLRGSLYADGRDSSNFFGPNQRNFYSRCRPAQFVRVAVPVRAHCTYVPSPATAVITTWPVRLSYVTSRSTIVCPQKNVCPPTENWTCCVPVPKHDAEMISRARPPESAAFGFMPVMSHWIRSSVSPSG